jgi:hypothetical protein
MEEDKPSFQLEFLPNYIRVNFLSGSKITPELIFEIIKQERTALDRRLLNDLWDARSCTISKNLNSQAISEVVNFINAQPEKFTAHKKTAFLVDSILAFGMGRMFQLIGGHLPYQAKIFEDENEAITWLTCAE